jgi:hypothetical protein
MENTLREVKTRREQLGQRLAVHADLENVLGEYPEKKETTNIEFGGGDVTRMYFIREIDRYLCRIEIDVCKMGLMDARRTTYMLSQVDVVYFKKNKVGLGLEIILRSKILRLRKRALKKASMMNSVNNI